MKTISNIKPLTIFTKRFILDVRQGSKYAIFSRFCWVFLRFFHPKIHPKIHHRPFNKVWIQTNLISLFEVHVKVFDKIVIKDFFVTFINIVQVTFSFYGVSSQISKLTHKCYKKLTHNCCSKINLILLNNSSQA